MDAKRTCPVCESDLPEDAKFFCPQCISELNWLDDVKDIPERNFSFERMQQTKRHRKIQIESASKVSKKPSCLVGFILIITGLSIITCWLTTWGAMLIDCLNAGLICPGKQILPGIVGILFLVAGLVEGIRSIINK